MDDDKLNKLAERLGAIAHDATISPDMTLNPLMLVTEHEGDTSAPHTPSGFDATHALPHTGVSVSELETLAVAAPSGPTTLDMSSLPTLKIAELLSENDAEFHVIGSLGTGGMGLVQHVKQRSLQRNVAFKRLKPGVEGPQFVQALLREAMFTGYLEHPNIVPVYQLGCADDGTPAFVMKRVDGESWRSVIQDPSHTFWETVTGDHLVWHLGVLMDVCNAVAYAHDKGILHRDIKPENIMIGGFGEVYLLDWGLGYRFQDSVQSQAVVGTPAYMAPEMLDKTTKRLGPHTDVYMLGASLHEVLTRAPRHTGKSVLEVLASASETLPFDYAEDVPRELAQIVNKACHSDPEQRFANASLLRDALGNFLQHRASVQLAKAAHVHLDTLRQTLATVPDDGSSEAEIYRIFSACQFGFEQALREWSENDEAHQGLQHTRLAMSHHVLDQGDLNAAKALMFGLDPVPDTLKSRIDALQVEQDSAVRRQEEDRKIAEAYDLKTFRKERWGVVFSVMPIMAVIAFGMLFGPVLGWFEVSGEMEVWLAIFMLVTVITVLRIKRDVFFKNLASRQLSLFAVAGNSALVVNRISGLVLERPLTQTYLNDCFLIMLFALWGAIMGHKLGIILAAIWGVGFGIGLVLQGNSSTIIMPVATILSFAAVILWFVGRRKH